MKFSHLTAVLLGAGALSTSINPHFLATARAQNVSAKPFLHPLFTDDAVLQRDRAIPVWGWATPGQKVTLKLDNKATVAKADASGKWMARIGPYPAGGPHTLLVDGGTPSQNITRKNILFGDVWLCSGQSNMEMGIRGDENGPQEVAAANFPNIRLFTVPQKTSLTPQENVDSAWLVCTPENVMKNSQGGVNGGNLGFSAVGYFFGRKIHQETGVPIGLIQSAWGGTIIEAWISEGSLGKIPDFRQPLANRKVTNAQSNLSLSERQALWLKANDPGFDPNWSNAEAGKDWRKISLPGQWDSTAEDLKNFDGVALFRREIIVPEKWLGHDLKLTLGAIDDYDSTFWNGTLLGSTSGPNTPRQYTIPAAQVKTGRNVIGVQVTDTGGPGGIHGPADAMKISLDDANTIALTGEWQYRRSVDALKLGSMPMADEPNNPNRIDVLYNGMIAPLEPFALKGAIWYQGESNADRPEQYGRLLPTLISDWREKFKSPLPFYIVQLAAFYGPDAEPQDVSRGPDWAALRQAQQRTSDLIGRSGIAVTTDIGNSGDIHPRNKHDVGLRLALNALAKDYGKKIEYSGPIFKTANIKDSVVELTFAHTEGGLSLKGDSDHVFAVAGLDRVWKWATPKVEGDKIILTSPISNPVYVRYAWSNFPRGTLYNGANLPAPPFQTVP